MAALGTGRDLVELPEGVSTRMEQDIDTVWDDLGPLKTFLVPAGCELACRLHLARTACRAAERAVVHLLNPVDPLLLHDPLAIQYLNRLGDLLFALARLANRDAGEPEVPWHAGQTP